RTSELVEVPPRHLADDIVEGGLEERRRPPRHAVRYVGERVAEAELRGDVREGVPGRLARERARAREPRVDLDDPIIERPCIDGVLDVALPDDAEVPNGSKRDASQLLVLVLRERLRRRDDDRLAGVDPHRVEILHAADSDAVVARVSDDLVLDLL